MADKTLNSRIVHKHDTETNWDKATNFIPKQGEIVVYDKDSNYAYERFKIGDGITTVVNLPFADQVHIHDEYMTNVNPTGTGNFSFQGNAWFAGDIKIGGTGQNDETAKTVATTDHEFITTADVDAICVVFEGHHLENRPGQMEDDYWGYTGWSGDFSTAIAVNKQYYKRMLKPGTYYIRNVVYTPYYTDPKYTVYTTTDANFMTTPTTSTQLTTTKTTSYTHNGTLCFCHVSAEEVSFIPVSDSGVDPDTSGTSGYIVVNEYTVPEGSYGIIVAAPTATDTYVEGYDVVFTSDPTSNIAVKYFDQAEVLV